MSLSFRSRVEHASVPVVDKLNSLPRWVPFLALLALMSAGAFVPRVGWLFTLVVVVFICWLLYLTWPRLSALERLFRVAVLLLIMAVTAVQAFPR